MNLRRHPVETDFISSALANARGDLPFFLDAARKKPTNLTLLSTEAIKLAMCAAVAEPDSPDVLRGLRIAARAHSALFAAAEGRELVVDLTEGEPIRYQTRVEESLLHAGRWLLGFRLAWICRDGWSLDQLATASTAPLRVSSTKSPEYFHPLLDAARAFQLGKPEAVDHLLAARAGALKLGTPWVRLIDGPQIDLLLAILRREEGFGELLTLAVRAHKEYWSKTADRRRDWDGYLAIGPLALASLAHDRGIPFEVDSDYMPQALIRGAGTS